MSNITFMKTFLKLISGFLLGTTVVYAQQKPLILGFAENPPFTILENGKAKGVAINIITKLFEKTKVPFTFVNVPLARGMDDAKLKENTCVFPVQRAQSNEADYLWVSPIFILNSGLYVNPYFKQEINTLVEAKKFKIGALRGSGDAEYLKGFGFKVEDTNTQDQNIKKLLSLKIDMWATDTVSANYFIRTLADKEKAPKEIFIFRRTLGSLACNTKTPREIIYKLQNTLDSMIKDGSLQKLTTTP